MSLNFAEVRCPIAGCDKILRVESPAVLPLDSLANAAKVKAHRLAVTGQLIGHINSEHREASKKTYCPIHGLRFGAFEDILTHLGTHEHEKWGEYTP